MRCEKCGAEVEAGEPCAFCAEAAGSLNVAAIVSAVTSAFGLLLLALIVQTAGASLLPGIGLGLVGLVTGIKADNDAKAGLCHKTALTTVGLSLSGASILGSICCFALMALLPISVLFPHEHPPFSRPLNSLKLLALAAMQYSQDYNETFPGWVRNPDGRYAHNVWDQQLAPLVKRRDWFNNLSTSGKGIRSYSQPGKHDRVLTYGLNGLLIAPPKGGSGGNADLAAFGRESSPFPLSPSAVANPSGTILFAELKTQVPMPEVYGHAPDPRPYTFKPGGSSREWRDALDGWIDVSPRDFVEIIRPVANNYNEPFAGATRFGVARDLYGGGGCYAFCDGHAKFLRIADTVGIGTTVNGRTITPENCWEAWNTNNMWLPQWRAGGKR